MVAALQVRRTPRIREWRLVGTVGAAMFAGLLFTSGIRDSGADRILGGGGVRQTTRPRVRVSFTTAGPTFQSGSLSVALRLRAVGYGASLHAVDRATLHSTSRRVLYTRPGIREWYLPSADGLEQGFDIARRRARDGAAPLTLAIALSGNARPTLSRGGRTLMLARAGGSLQYSGLSATDASHRPLHSWLTLRGHALLVHVDTTHARYPIDIDPYIQQGAKITAQGAGGLELFGSSVALSADGNTALVGASNESPPEAAYVLSRSGESWHQQARLTVGEPTFGVGASIALSADGNTALVGAPREGNGAAWIFTRNGTEWHRGPKLTGAHASGAFPSQFGAAVSLSADGTTALIGGNSDDEFAGAAWIFTRSGQEWHEAAKLTGSDTLGSAEFGASVALSEDASTALIGGPGNETIVEAQGEVTEGSPIVRGLTSTTGFGGSSVTGPKIPHPVAVTQVLDEHEIELSAPAEGEGSATAPEQLDVRKCCGSAWTFNRSGNTWIQQGAPFTGQSGPYDPVQPARFGQYVALSGGGSTALIGPSDEGSEPVVPVFTRSALTWTRIALLHRSGVERNSGFGESAALSGDGRVAIVGASGDDELAGSALVFTDSRGTWSQQTPKLIGSETVGTAAFGSSVALDAAGDTAMVGGPFDEAMDLQSAGNGAVWVFVPQPPPPVVSVVAPVDGAVSSASMPMFSWSASDEGGPGLAHLQFLLDGVQLGGDLPAGTSNFTPTTALPDGVHSWQVRAVDKLGFATTTPARTITIDTIPPTTPILGTPSENTRILQAIPTFTWAPASDATSGVGSYTLIIDGAPAASLSPGSCPPTCTLSAPHPLANGTHSWQIIATDRAGNNAPSATQQFVIAVGPPPPPGPVGLSINTGDYATNNPHVKLDIVWPAGVTQAFISNDGGFQLAGQTALLPVAAHIPWKLSSQGNERLPKTVYLRFPDSANPLITLTDSITLDTTTPTIHQARLLTTTGGGRRHDAEVELAVHEDVSGVSVIQLSEGLSGGRTVRFRARTQRGLVDPHLLLHFTTAASNGRTSSTPIKVRPPRHPKWVRVQSAAGTWSHWHRVS
jgi:hypothetical protein